MIRGTGYSRLSGADRSIFRWVVARRRPRLDRVFRTLSESANHSLLWFAFALLTALLGGRGSKPAASRALASLGLASTLANGPLKLGLRRRRPFDSQHEGMSDVLHLLVRRPVTTSFPSGHSASAAAFATSLALSGHPAAIPATILAGGVAFSRVYLGAHYPGDVIAGVGVGVASAVAVGRLTKPPASLGECAAVEPHVPVSVPEGEGLVAVVNPSSGAGENSGRGLILEAFPLARAVEIADGFESQLSDAAAIAAVGGDGTVNACTGPALNAGVPLAVIPAGTLNHLARDLGVGSEQEGLDAIAGGEVGLMDVGRIADHVFLNTASFGAYPAIVREREQRESAIGKWPALVYASVKVLIGHRPIRVRIDGEAMRIWGIFIGNCLYEPQGTMPRSRRSLSDGQLDVRIMHAKARFSRSRAVVASLRGPRRGTTFEARIVNEMEIEILDGAPDLAADGEVFRGPRAFRVDKRARSLQVFVPPQQG